MSQRDGSSLSNYRQASLRPAICTVIDPKKAMDKESRYLSTIARRFKDEALML